MPGNSLASQTINLNFVNLLACIKLASHWFKNNQLLSEVTHAHYREPIPLIMDPIFFPSIHGRVLHRRPRRSMYSNEYINIHMDKIG